MFHRRPSSLVQILDNDLHSSIHIRLCPW
jgi:hypothetical protein